MTQVKYEVSPLFAEPIFRADIGHAISDAQIDYLKNLPMIQNRTNFISDNLYIFNEPEMASIKHAVHEVLDVYAREVMGISQKLYVTQSWTLKNQQNIGMHGHTHSNSLISGSLYFCDLPPEGGRMIFDRNRTYQQLQLPPEDGKQNLYNAPMNVITPKKNEILLFSSSLQHLVESNMSAQTRYSIAFNTFLKGTIGNYRDVSVLEL